MDRQTDGYRQINRQTDRQQNIRQASLPGPKAQVN